MSARKKRFRDTAQNRIDRAKFLAATADLVDAAQNALSMLSGVNRALLYANDDHKGLVDAMRNVDASIVELERALAKYEDSPPDAVRALDSEARQ
jgi:hypothetical protein